MVFVPPMWDNECERIGKKLCTPAGALLHSFAEITAFCGLLMEVVGAGLFVFSLLSDASSIWPACGVIITGLLVNGCGRWLYWYSWKLARRKKFSYDATLREASWIEGGQQRVFGPEQLKTLMGESGSQDRHHDC